MFTEPVIPHQHKHILSFSTPPAPQASRQQNWCAYSTWKYFTADIIVCIRQYWQLVYSHIKFVTFSVFFVSMLLSVLFLYSKVTFSDTLSVKESLYLSKEEIQEKITVEYSDFVEGGDDISSVESQIDCYLV